MSKYNSVPVAYSATIDEPQFGGCAERILAQRLWKVDTRSPDIEGYGLVWDGRHDLAAIAREGCTMGSGHFFGRSTPGFCLRHALAPLDWYLDLPEINTMLRFELTMVVPRYFKNEPTIAKRFLRAEPGSMAVSVSVKKPDNDKHSNALVFSTIIAFGRHARQDPAWPKHRILDIVKQKMSATPGWRRAGLRIVDADPGGASHMDLSIACDHPVVGTTHRVEPTDHPTEVMQAAFGSKILVPRAEVRAMFTETMRYVAADTILSFAGGEIRDLGDPAFHDGPPLRQLQSFRERVARGSTGWFFEGLMSVPQEVIDRLIWHASSPPEPVLLPIFHWCNDRKMKGLPVGRSYYAALSRDGDERRLVISTFGINEAAQLNEIEETTGITGWTRDLPPSGQPVTDLEPVIDLELD